MGAPYLIDTTWPLQDMDELLLCFTSAVMSRHSYKQLGTGVTFEEWQQWGLSDPETSPIQMFKDQARNLFDNGLLNWPEDTRSLGVAWHVDGPGQNRGAGRAPGLPWVRTFGFSAAEAISYANACRLVNQPHRLSWSFRS